MSGNTSNTNRDNNPDKKAVTIFEVGPRDGLQNEKGIVSPAAKVRFVEMLAAAGHRKIEVTSFVRPGVIPQLSDAGEVYPGVKREAGKVYAALVPNVKGMENALAAGVQEIAVFTAASETFTQKNINCTIAESLERFAAVRDLARENNIPVRGYVSTVVECPYEGKIKPEATLTLSRKLLDMGCYEVSLGETIGVAVPEEIARLLDVLVKEIPAEKLAGHYHDTRSTALANVARSLEYGLRTFDASAAGLGGCPYAPGAAGNLATEDLIYTLHRSGYETGVDLVKLMEASRFISGELNRAVSSRVYQSELAKSAVST